MQAGGPKLRQRRHAGLALLVILSGPLMTSCVKRINCSISEIYYELWKESEEELLECIERADRLATP